MARAKDTAYHEIRRRILSGELTPGVQLKEEELAELCGVSRTPVRDALRRLEIEMLVLRSDTQRTFVPYWTADEVEEVFSLRAIIEGHAAARAARFREEEHLAEFHEINAAISEAIHREPEPDTDTFVMHNRRFHALMVDAAKSPRLTRIATMIVEQSIVHRTAQSYDRQALIHSHRDHCDLVAAIEQRDAHWAEAVMLSHIRRAYHTFDPDMARDA